METFVVNRHGRLIFPANFWPDLDFSVFEALEQLEAVVKRDFEDKAPTGTEILNRVESDGYRNRYDLLRDLALNLSWVNRYAMTMYEKRPTRWRDVPRERDDVFLPVLTPCEEGEQKVAAVEMVYEAAAGRLGRGGGRPDLPDPLRRLQQAQALSDGAAGDQAHGGRDPPRPEQPDLSAPRA